MSLTGIIKNKTIEYWHIMSLLDVDLCHSIIKHHNDELAKRMVHRPVPGSLLPQAGMAVIYALREYVGSNWDETVAGKRYPYPDWCPYPGRWVVMALLDSEARRGGRHFEIEALPTNLQATAEDVGRIVSSFSAIIGESSRYLATPVYPNPIFEGSYLVGGADANLIVGNCLWDVRTSAKRHPMTIDDIVRQVGYYLLDLRDEFGLENATWFYSRQNCVFNHSIQSFLLNPSLDISVVRSQRLHSLT